MARKGELAREDDASSVAKWKTLWQFAEDCKTLWKLRDAKILGLIFGQFLLRSEERFELSVREEGVMLCGFRRELFKNVMTLNDHQT